MAMEVDGKEWPAMILTVSGQCVAGGFIVLALALMRRRLCARKRSKARSPVCHSGADAGIGLYRLISVHLASADARV